MLLVIVVAMLPTVAFADPVDLSLGVVADLEAVRHAINGNLETFTAPLPFFTFEARTSRLSFAAEALSTFGPLAFGGEDTKLDVDIAALRVHLVRGAFIGAGLTALNQTTTFDPFTYYPGPIIDNLTERSHLNGVRYEFGYEGPRFSFVIGATPALHGDVFDHCLENTTFAVGRPCFDNNYTTIDLKVPEISSAFDATIRYTIPLQRHVDLVSGFRYITFVGKVTYPDKISTDQNSGAPLLSVGLRVHTR